MMHSRVLKEIQQIEMEKISGIKVEILDDGYDISCLRATIEGPKGTPYELGSFHIDIRLPDTYPFSAPYVRFLTKIWHPNVNSVNGAICGLGSGWSASMTIGTLLISLQALLSAPDPLDPCDGRVAHQFMTEYTSFEATARIWTQAFAMKNRLLSLFPGGSF